MKVEVGVPQMIRTALLAHPGGPGSDAERWVWVVAPDDALSVVVETRARPTEFVNGIPILGAPPEHVEVRQTFGFSLDGGKTNLWTAGWSHAARLVLVWIKDPSLRQEAQSA